MPGGTDAASGAGPFTILTVCTANVCRSPLAAHVLGATLATRLPAAGIAVTSAGVDADPGQSMCPGAAQAAGAGSQDHRARVLTADLLAAADLIVTADRTQRAAAARLLPACRPRLFTLRQGAALAQAVSAELAGGRLPDGAPPLPADPAGRLRWLVGEMDAARGLLAGQPEGSEDIVDRHGPAPHPAVFAEVEQAATGLAEALASAMSTGRR